MTKKNISLFLLHPLLFCHAFPTFRDEIPNGRHVPNPGPQGGVWAGVGHEATSGGGPRNPFGLDFAEVGFRWTTELCGMDSDGDGRTNGEELGDPNCEWEKSLVPALPASSHPGIPDQPPTGNNPPNGNNSCDNYNPPLDTVAIDVAFSKPNFLDGATRTQYVCEQKTIKAPSIGGVAAMAFHQIRSGITQHNEDVLHHIWVYTCDNGDSSDGNRVGQGAYGCSGIEANCQIVAGWALGGDDFCEPPNVGSYIDFGPQGSKVFKVEAHYDNAMLLPQEDQSGMRLYLTPTLRPLNSGLVVLGMDYYDRQFVIPTGEASYELTNICPTTATQQLSNPIWVYSWNPHMHYYGKSLVTEHYRCGKKIGEIGRIEAFEFDNQQTYLFDEPIKILPGDALITTCTYDTRNVMDGPVLGGEETTDEMCDNYLTYYPFAGSETEPDFFTGCASFQEGLNPDWADGYDDNTPFVTLGLGGNRFVSDFDPNPANNVASCCFANDNGKTCEYNFLSAFGGPCAVDSDCRGEGAECHGGLCLNATSSAIDDTTGDDTDNVTSGSAGDPPTVSGGSRTRAGMTSFLGAAMVILAIISYIF